VLSVSRYGFATVRFTERKIFHLTQASLQHLLSLRDRVASPVETVVLVVVAEAVETEKRTKTKFLSYQ
jgi:hypothetical protein